MGEVQGVAYYRIYILLTEYIDFLTKLEASVRSQGNEVIIGGDFNAKAHKWGSSVLVGGGKHCVNGPLGWIW